MNKNVLEKMNVKQAFAVAKDLATATTGARVSMAKNDCVAFVVDMNTSSATTPTFTLRQHNAASSGTSKDLVVANPYYHKVAGQDVFTKVEPSVAAAQYVLTSLFATAAGMVVFVVRGEDLDVDGGFAWVSLDIAAAGNAKTAAGIVLMDCPRFLPAYKETTI